MLLSTVARCYRFPTVTGILSRYRSPLDGPIRRFRNGGDLTQSNHVSHPSADNVAAKHVHQNALASHFQVKGPPEDPVAELGLPAAATSNCVGNSHYWQQIPVWKNVSEVDFLSYQWQVNKDFLMCEP